MNYLLYVPNPLLRQKAEKIKSVGSDEKKIANKMMDVMLRAPGVGLAANQIGILNWNYHCLNLSYMVLNPLYTQVLNELSFKN